MSNLKIAEKISGDVKSYTISHIKGDSVELIAEVKDSMDTLLITYMLNKALDNDFNQDEFKDYLLKIAPEVPFIEIPKE